jgi:hypothetical protein
MGLMQIINTIYPAIRLAVDLDLPMAFIIAGKPMKVAV